MTDDDQAGAWAEYPGFGGLTPAHAVCQCGTCRTPLLSRDHKDEKDADDRYGSGDGLPPLVRAFRTKRLEGLTRPHRVPYCLSCWEASHADRRPAWSAAGGKYAMGG